MCVAPAACPIGGLGYLMMPVALPWEQAALDWHRCSPLPRLCRSVDAL
jgi:hypothetical protein